VGWPVSKLVLITGAGGGIGRATARRFAKAGWNVAISDIQPAALGPLAAELGQQLAASLVVDVSDADSVGAALRTIGRQNNGRLDLLVNNAGLAYLDSFETKPLSFHHALEAVNIRGVLNCTYLAFPYLKAASGRIINLCSTSAIYGIPGMATYSASKFWVRGFTEALNLEWESQGILACDVMPSLVQTAMTHGIDGKLVRTFGIHLTPEDVANAVFDATRGRRVHRLVDKSFFTRMQLRVLAQLPQPLKRFAIKRATIG
jgi:NAD(P)-dependent dehydrogenase (short-subunit alcohol dehydrogenase family)